MSDNVILRVTSKIFIPFILLFGLYVQFHGDFGPGGGFQAGVIFAAGLILYALIWGIDAAKRIAHPNLLQWAGAIGVLLYAGTGAASFFLGGTFLDYNALDHHDPVQRPWLHTGIDLDTGRRIDLRVAAHRLLSCSARVAVGGAGAEAPTAGAEMAPESTESTAVRPRLAGGAGGPGGNPDLETTCQHYRAVSK